MYWGDRPFQRPHPQRGKKILASFQKRSQTGGRGWPLGSRAQPQIYKSFGMTSPPYTQLYLQTKGLGVFLAASEVVVCAEDPLWGLLGGKQEFGGIRKVRGHHGAVLSPSPPAAAEPEKTKSVSLKPQAAETRPWRHSSLRREQLCLPLSLTFTESAAGHCVLLQRNKIPLSSEFVLKPEGTVMGQLGAIQLLRAYAGRQTARRAEDHLLSLSHPGRGGHCLSLLVRLHP